MPKPNFFIVGAAKSGTTSLYACIRQHPDVFMPEFKEPHFFGTDLNAPWFLRDEKRYLALFTGATEKRIGEASAYYLYSKKAAREIRQFNNSAKIIIILRNPVSMIHSLHSHLFYHGREDIEDFGNALAVESERKCGNHIPKFPHLKESLFYHEIVKYAEQVERFFNAFGRENVSVLLFDDFINNSLRVYRGICRFLDIEETFVPSFTLHNPNKKIKNRMLKNVLCSLPPPITTIRDFLPTALRSRVSSLMGGLHTSYESRRPINPVLREQLKAEFLPGIEELENLIGKDLSMWK